TIANIAKARFAILDTLQLVKTKAVTIAQNLYTAAVGKGTVAAKLFRGALAATGIGAVVLLLGELIFNFDGVSRKINQAINYIRDFSQNISNGNKVVMFFVEALLFVASPLVTIIRLITDFRGTIQGFQNAIFGAVDSVLSLTDRLGVVCKVIRNLAEAYKNFFNITRILGAETKKYKVSVEDLSKIYDTFTANLEQNSKALQRQIKLTTAQGKSESQVAELTKKLLAETTKARQDALEVAVKIQNKLIKQNGKLNDEQQVLFNKVQNDFEDAKIEQEVFDAERNKAARDNALERLGIEQDLTARINQLRNNLIKDEFEKQQAELDESLRLDLEANENKRKEFINNKQLTKKISDQLEEEAKLLQKKFNEDSFAITFAQLDKEADITAEKISQDQLNIKNSFAFKSEELAKSFALEQEFQDASFHLTAQTEQGKTKQLQNQQIKRLEATSQYLQDQLALTKQFALEDQIFSPEELLAVDELTNKIKNLQLEMAKLKGEP
ncbi:MAG: hypothetical protein AABY22_01630, partial [Nanoarchaeota archaeon]